MGYITGPLDSATIIDIINMDDMEGKVDGFFVVS